MRKPVISITRKLPTAIERRMMELFDARFNVSDEPMTSEQIIASCEDADVLVPTVTDNLDAGLIVSLARNVRLIANFGVGVNHIDLNSIAARNIVVTNTPGVLTDDTADLTIALLLSVSRRLAEGAKLAASGSWAGWSPTFLMGHRVTGKRLGIIGMGRIGKAVAQRARGFGISINYHNRRRVQPDVEAQLQATFWSNLDLMLTQMDLISVNCPQTPETFGLLNSERLDKLQRHAVIVNTARGGIIDEEALADRLARGSIAGAGLDVYQNEPAIHPKLLFLDNVILSPHLGSATHEGRIEMGEKVICNIKMFFAGHEPPDRVLVGGNI